MTRTKRFGLPVAAILILCGAGNAAGIEELIACDTTRANTAYDLGRSCDGSPFSRPVNDELGWTAGAERDDIYFQGGDVFSESGLPGQVRTCIELPVWCCW